MPFRNHFQHQTYTADAVGRYELIKAPFPPQPGTPEYSQTTEKAGLAIAQEVDAVYLIHGTFAGNDALGWTAQIERVWPKAAEHVRDIGKKIVDVLADDQGNFTNEYAKELENLLNARAIASSSDDRDSPSSDGATGSGDQEGLIAAVTDGWTPVRRFHWSGENNHAGRCLAAIELLEELLDHQRKQKAEHRVLLLCHSHAGNVLAVVSNLLGADEEQREAFLDLISPVYRDEVEQDRLSRVRDGLAQADVRSSLRLDVATMGTPIRYGWDSAGYRNLLHFVNHVPRVGEPEHLSPVADLKAKNVLQVDGDFVQQFGIAGTNFLPYLFDLRLVLTEQKLNNLLQPFGRENFWEHLKIGMRVSQEGQTLLVDYDDTKKLSQQLAGHGVYTQSEWLAFHLSQIGDRFYR